LSASASTALFRKCRLYHATGKNAIPLGKTLDGLRWLYSYWFWLGSGSVAMVVLFGILALVAQFFYWADIVKGLNDQPVEGNGRRDID